MAVTNEASGTQAATVGTEHTLATIATAKVFQLYVDISALAAGEHVELKVKSKVLSGGTTRALSSAIYSWRDAAIDPIAVSIPIMSDQECVCTLKQLDGTGRSFPWAVKTP
jgi:hypothetical protein